MEITTEEEMRMKEKEREEVKIETEKEIELMIIETEVERGIEETIVLIDQEVVTIEAKVAASLKMMEEVIGMTILEMIKNFIMMITMIRFLLDQEIMMSETLVSSIPEQGLQEGMGEIVFKVRKCSVRGLVLVSNNQTTRVMISSNFIFNTEDGEGVEAEVVEEDLEDEASL